MNDSTNSTDKTNKYKITEAMAKAAVELDPKLRIRERAWDNLSVEDAPRVYGALIMHVLVIEHGFNGTFRLLTAVHQAYKMARLLHDITGGDDTLVESILKDAENKTAKEPRP
jgi:hypothetical protein